MTKDKVIEYAKDWVHLLNYRAVDICTHKIQMSWNEEVQEQVDVLNAVIDLAFTRTKEALIEYAKYKEQEFKKHDTMLDTIEELLQEKVKDIKDVVGKE